MALLPDMLVSRDVLLPLMPVVELFVALFVPLPRVPVVPVVLLVVPALPEIGGTVAEFVVVVEPDELVCAKARVMGAASATTTAEVKMYFMFMMIGSVKG